MASYTDDQSTSETSSSGAAGMTASANYVPIFGSDTANSSTQVSVFAYPNLNGTDTSPGSNNENANLASIVQNIINNGGDYTLDTSITDFAADNFSDQLYSSGFFFMTDMESQSPTDTAFFPESAQATLRSWVNDGGVMMMTGTSGSSDTNFLNLIFNWDLTTQSGSSWELNSPNASGTPFADGPASLNNLSATDAIGKGTVSSFTPIYGTEDNATVATMTYGSGTVIFLGYDYFNSGISGTGFVDSTQYTTDVSNGASNTNDWVTEMIPRAMQYSASLSSAYNLTPSESGFVEGDEILVTDLDVDDEVSISVTGVLAQQEASDGTEVTADPSLPSNAELLAMLSLSSPVVVSSTETQGSVTWSFNAANTAFAYLGQGEKLLLTYTLTADDGKGGVATHDVELIVNGINDSPVLANSGDALRYTEGDTATVIDSSLTLTDVDSDTMTSATVTLSSGYVQSEDVLAFIDANGISGSWDASTGILTLSGLATQAEYEAALKSVTYQNTNTANPDASARTVSWVVNDGEADSAIVASTINVLVANDLPTGSVLITGSAAEDETLTASHTLADEDGLGTINYQWLRDGTVITGATDETYTLTQSDVGAAISVRASYVDDQGTSEAVTSAATAAVSNVNDAPTGSVIITGTAVPGEVLTASNTLADEDGLGTINYQWLRDGEEIPEATEETYTLTQADVSSNVSVRASYIDQQGTTEVVASAMTTISARDEDGVPDEDEARVPSLDGNSTGDGNGDDIPDAEQSSVSSVPFLFTPTAVSNPGDAAEAFITLSSNGSGTSGSSASALALRNVRQLDAPDDQPNDLNMPFGLIAFESDVETVGGSNAFSLFVDGDLDVNGYWKQDAEGDWVNLASADFGGSLTRVGNKIRFDFVIEDGGEFDSDGIANGVIVDPGAIGFRAPEEPEPTPEPIPDEAFNRAPVANDDAFSGRFGWLLRGNLFEDNGSGADKDADNDAISITDIGGQAVVFDTAMVLASGATVTVQENGDFLYDQRAAFDPSQDQTRFQDIFEYSIEDTRGAENTAVVSVELTEADDAVEISILHALYEVAFDRKADASGLDYWSDVHKEGVSAFDIADAFLASEEFVSDHSNSLSDDDYLTMLYANAFDRAPDADGFEYWSEILEAPTVDRGDVMTYFALSDEMQIKYLAEGFIFA